MRTGDTAEAICFEGCGDIVELKPEGEFEEVLGAL